MRTTRSLAALPTTLLALLVGACVTINVYFPAAAAERAADRVIQEVWGEGQGPAPAPSPAAPPEAPRSDGPWQAGTLLGAVLDLVVTPAAAQADIDVSSPGIRRLTAAMQARHAQLEPHYQRGAVGLTGDGLVTLRDAAAVPLQERRTVSQLVADENRDRGALYREVAVANGHPEWEKEVRASFARRWVANARKGWWYQDAGGAWTRK
jgi:uncharacterized protein YdbL (DUF1318 family)